MDLEKILQNFYYSQEEDNRFSSKHGMVEYITTLKYIDKYLQVGQRILEIGCGTGKYALHYARKGYRIDAIDLMQINLDVLHKNMLPTDNICAIQGNALDLSAYKDEIFDITLLLGPMYHLFTDADKIKCLQKLCELQKNKVLFL